MTVNLPIVGPHGASRFGPSEPDVDRWRPSEVGMFQDEWVLGVAKGP